MKLRLKGEEEEITIKRLKDMERVRKQGHEINIVL
jgi:hypothetical protein